MDDGVGKYLKACHAFDVMMKDTHLSPWGGEFIWLKYRWK